MIQKLKLKLKKLEENVKCIQQIPGVADKQNGFVIQKRLAS